MKGQTELDYGVSNGMQPGRGRQKGQWQTVRPVGALAHSSALHWSYLTGKKKNWDENLGQW